MTRFILALSFILASCGYAITDQKPLALTKAQTADVEKKVSYQLKDPESAQFRNIRAVRATRENGEIVETICGEFNARNAFGGYVGFSNFTAQIIRGEISNVAISTPETSWLYQAC